MINLYVYTGDSEHQGVCPQNVQVIRSFAEIDSRIDFNTVNNQELNTLLNRISTEHKEKNTLLVFPGGTPSLWDHQLSETIEKVTTFIENGGNALMICAGAYFSANLTIFDHIRKAHGLNFFPGIAVGPFKVSKISLNQARAVEVTNANGEKGFLYLNQGGYFIPDQNKVEGRDYKTLLRYNDGNIAAAQSDIQKGSVVMTFPHIEYSGLDLAFENQPFEVQESIAFLREKLSASESFRVNFIKAIFKNFFPD